MNRSSLLVLGVAAAGVLLVGLYLESSRTSSSSSSAPQNAVNPNAQDAPGGPFAAQGTMPDFGNLLSYNQVVGSVTSAPQATSITSGVTGA